MKKEREKFRERGIKTYRGRQEGERKESKLSTLKTSH